MDLGLGIHSEPGAAMTSIQLVEVVISHVRNPILPLETYSNPIRRGNRVELMVNGFGATPIRGLMIASRKAVLKLQLEHGLAIDRVYTRSVLTSLDISGFKISTMEVVEIILLF